MAQLNTASTDSPAAVSEAAIDALFDGSDLATEEQIKTLCDAFLCSDDSIDNAVSMRDLQKVFSTVEIPDQHWEMKDYLTLLAKEVVPHSSHLTAPTYIGHMTSPLPAFIRQLSQLVMVMNQNMMKMESCRGLGFLERQVLAMLHREVFSRDDGFYQNSVQHSSFNLGCFTSGGTIANITAMWLALKAGHKLGGVGDDQRGTIIGSELMHYSFDKAACLIGMRLIRLPVTADYRLSIPALRQALQQCEANGEPVVALVAVAGTTDFGSVDPLAEVATIARLHKIHFHVDAAWGGPMMLCDKGREMLRGIELADSVTIDGHKQLMTPMGCGILLTRQPEALESIRKQAPYAIRETSLDQGRFTLEGSRPAMALYLHAAFHLLGRERYSLLMESSLARTRELAQMIDEAESFELMHEPRMNLLVFRYLPISMRNHELSAADNDWISAFNTQLQKRQRAMGSSFVSRTRRKAHNYQGQSLVLLRAVLLNPLTRTRHLRQVTHDLCCLGQQLEQELAEGETILEVA